MEIGKKIRQLRFKANLTQEELAERLGIAAQSVSKWENSVSMPDITLLPLISEVFGVSIDELFDLSTEQRLNRIESRVESEEELPQDVFSEYEAFLKEQLKSEKYAERATELLAYLYWQRMDAAARRVRIYAKEAIRKSPGKKYCQWMLGMADGHAVWDWNMNNHTRAIDFYRDVVESNPEVPLPYLYLIDNLLADHRASDAESYLNRMCALPNANKVMADVYRAYIALERFDEHQADEIMAHLTKEHPEESPYLFEAAQYYARKCDYKKAIELYEQSFEKTTRKPRFQDELLGISAIYQIMGDYKKAAETYDRIIGLLQAEWGMTEEVELADAKNERDRLLGIIK